MKKIRTIIILLTVTAVTLCACGKAEIAQPYGVGRAEVYTSDGVTVPESELPAPEAKPDTISIVMVGDILLHDEVTNSGIADDGTRNYDHIFANVADTVKAADLALVNEEVILGGEELGFSGYPRFNGPTEVGDAEVAAGFDVILQATNHSLDKGKDGLVNNLEFWRTNYPDIPVTGIYDSADARDKICVVTVSDVRIAILNYTYSTNGREMPDGMPWAVAMLDEDMIRADFEKAREQSDFIIVCPHWGTEYSHGVSNSQRKWADLFVELGADLIIGAHPHVIEPLETLTDSDGREVPVYWSVGNFICYTGGTGDGVADRMLGAMAKITLSVDRADGLSVSVKETGAIPLVTQMEKGYRKSTTYFLDDYTEQLAAENDVRQLDPSFSIDYCRDLWNEVMGAALTAD